MIEIKKMNYTDKEVEKYIKILKSIIINIDKKLPIKSNKVTCNNCQKSDFTIESGYVQIVVLVSDMLLAIMIKIYLSKKISFSK